MYLSENKKIWLATGSDQVFLEPSMANRHGFIAGATGTGKTVTLKVMAEAFSDMGVPVFIADIKGDLTGMCVPGQDTKHILRSKERMKLEEYGYTFKNYPVRFFDVYGKSGHPVRATISDMGPQLIARLLGLNETQAGVLNIIFHIADDKGLMLIDLKDLRAFTQYVGENADEYKLLYGNIASSTIGSIQRALLTLLDQGGDQFFGEPALNLSDWFAWDDDGRGVMNILECQELFMHPLLYSTFLLWMLSELYEMMPECGDLDKPKIVFFFDEAHLLFDDAPKALLDKIEQVVRLIRSKGVSVWFISQQPSDMPDPVLAQLNNRVQHALRAYTPNEQKGLKAAANSFRANPEFDTMEVLQSLGVGEALISLLDEKGIPTIVQRASVLPPQSSMDMAPSEVIAAAIAASPLGAKYSEAVDNVSAYEMLQEENRQKAEAEAAAAHEAAKAAEEEKARKEQEKAEKAAASKKKKTTSVFQKAVSSTANTIGREVGKKLVRGILGGLFKG